jgi:peptide deformylase
MAARPILLLGDPRLYERAAPIEEGELPGLRSVIEDLFDTMRAFRDAHGWGRGIAAPQIGVPRRLVCLEVGAPVVLVNPVIEDRSDEQIELWEDCMSFPELLVRLRNPARCRVRFRDVAWHEQVAEATDDLAELVQHEIDHLDGILSIQRALDERSIVLRRSGVADVPAPRGRFTLSDLAERA